MIHVIYRVSNSEKPGVRPKYYSKAFCFKTLVDSLKFCSEKYSLTSIYDGNLENQEFARIAKTEGDLLNINLKNNAGSFLFAYKHALNYKPNNIVYFVEDDYFHLKDAISELGVAFKMINPDYLTLYDHPVRYAEDYKFGLDLPTNGTIYFAGHHHWRHQESTCMTFAARVATLTEDKELFQRYNSKDVPEDRELFRRLQGLVGYEKGSPKRTLIGPMPSLATHLHLPWLAPGIDWGNESEK